MVLVLSSMMLMVVQLMKGATRRNRPIATTTEAPLPAQAQQDHLSWHDGCMHITMCTYGFSHPRFTFQTARLQQQAVQPGYARARTSDGTGSLQSRSLVNHTYSTFSKGAVRLNILGNNTICSGHFVFGRAGTWVFSRRIFGC